MDTHTLPWNRGYAHHGKTPLIFSGNRAEQPNRNVGSKIKIFHVMHKIHYIEAL